MLVRFLIDQLAVDVSHVDAQKLCVKCISDEKLLKGEKVWQATVTVQLDVVIKVRHPFTNFLITENKTT